MTIENGEYQTNTVQEIEDHLLERVQENFEDEINDGDFSTFRFIYRPIAEKFVELQEDIGFVLDSTHINKAEGQALDLLVALIGVFRREATHSTGEVRFYRNSEATEDYSIPVGVRVRTDSDEEQVHFETTEFAELSEGETEVIVPVQALEAGTQSNMAAGTVSVMVNSPAGIESVINDEKIVGGRNQETDNELRGRAQIELSEGSRATSDSLLTAVSSIKDTTSAKIFPNHEHNLGDDPGFEIVVSGGDEQKIAEKIINTKAAGDHTYAGNFGNAIHNQVELSNGQDFTVSFSRPNEVELDINIELETTSTYQNDDDVRNNIIKYIGGVNSLSEKVNGEINVGDDVIIGEIKYAIRDVPGVYDITTLEISDGGQYTTQNYPIEDNENATTNAANISITVL